MSDTNWKPEGFDRPSFTENDVKAILAEVHARLPAHLQDYGDGIFLHPHTIVGCMYGQVKKLSDAAADTSLNTGDLADFRKQCVETLLTMIVALTSVDKLTEMRKETNPPELVIYVGDDDLCQCDCSSACPLGRMGMEERCTKEELEAAGIRTKNP